MSWVFVIWELVEIFKCFMWPCLFSLSWLFFLLLFWLYINCAVSALNFEKLWFYMKYIFSALTGIYGILSFGLFCHYIYVPINCSLFAWWLTLYFMEGFVVSLLWSLFCTSYSVIVSLMWCFFHYSFGILYVFMLVPCLELLGLWTSYW